MSQDKGRTRVRAKLQGGWNVDILPTREKYRIVRPEAASEVIGRASRRLGYPLRQPDPRELEQMPRVLAEPGEWRIERTQVDMRSFDTL